MFTYCTHIEVYILCHSANSNKSRYFTKVVPAFDHFLLLELMYCTAIPANTHSLLKEMYLYCFMTGLDSAASLCKKQISVFGLIQSCKTGGQP